MEDLNYEASDNEEENPDEEPIEVSDDEDYDMEYESGNEEDYDSEGEDDEEPVTDDEEEESNNASDDEDEGEADSDEEDQDTTVILEDDYIEGEFDKVKVMKFPPKKTDNLKSVMDFDDAEFCVKYPPLKGIKRGSYPIFDDLVSSIIDKPTMSLIVNTFDQWLDNDLEKILRNRMILTTKDEKEVMVEFTNITITSPKTRNGVTDLFPQDCFRDQITYGAFVEFDISISKYVGKREIKETKKFGTILPIPTYSRYCNFSKTGCIPSHHGEDPEIPGGYFIINGSRIVGVTHENVSLCKAMLYIDNEDHVCRLMVNNREGSSCLTQLIKKAKRDDIRYWISSYIKTKKAEDGSHVEYQKNKKRKTINIFYIFRALGIESVIETKKRIFKYIPTDKQEKAQKFLDYTENLVALDSNRNISYNALVQAILHKSGKSGKREEIRKKDWDRKKDRQRYKEAVQGQLLGYEEIVVRDFVDGEIVSYIDVPSEDEDRTSYYEEKIEIISFLVAKMIRTLTGEIIVDDRNAIYLKRFRTICRYIDTYIRAFWRYYTEQIAKNVGDRNNNEVGITEVTARDGYNFGRMIIDSFHSGKWKANTSSRPKEGISQRPDSYNIVSIITGIIHTDTSIPRKSAKRSVRALRPDGLGFIAAETPENKSLGLSKNTALGACRVSFQRDYLQVHEQVMKSGLISKKYKGLVVILEGRIIGRTRSRDIDNETLSLRELRRNLVIEHDVSISVGVMDEIYIDCSCDRLIRPLIVLDDDEELKINNPEEMRSLNPALNNRHIEYIDAAEQLSLKIAPRINAPIMRNLKVMALQRDISAIDELLTSNTIYPSLRTEIEEIIVRLEKTIAELESKITSSTNQEIIARFREAIAKNHEVIQDRNNSLKNNVIPKYKRDELEERKKNTNLMILRILRQRKYSHSEIDPLLIETIGTAMAPYANCMPNLRKNYQANMSRQCQSWPDSYVTHFRGQEKIQLHSQHPVCTNIIKRTFTENRPMGSNCMFAICLAGAANTDEDCFGIKQEAVELGLNERMVVNRVSAPISSNQRFDNPERLGIRKLSEPADKYATINPAGVAIVGAKIEIGQTITGRIYRDSDGSDISNPVIADQKTEGYVTDVGIKYGALTIMETQVNCVYKLEAGDKISPWCAQKGTGSAIIPSCKMPYDEETGEIPDIIMNPHSTVTRCTQSLFFETFASLIGAHTGQHIESTMYRDVDLEWLDSEARRLGIEDRGKRWMRNPITGERYLCKIFMGVINIQQLRHFVVDKRQLRNVGPVKNNNQPVEGKENDGGLRFGEMERDCALSSGASGMVQERLSTLSDYSVDIICKACGSTGYPVYNYQSNEITLKCEYCPGNKGFVKKGIPYVYKVLRTLCGSLSSGMNYVLNDVESQLEELIEVEDTEKDTETG